MNRKAFVALDLIIVIGIIAVTGGIVSKAIATSFDDHQKQVCARNLQRLASAMSIYQEDYESRNPVNRVSPTAPGSSARVFLPPESGPYSGINYVSALEPYLYGETTTHTRKAWRCPAVDWELYAAPNAHYPPHIPGYGKAYVTYIINYWMLEINYYSVRNPAKTILFRENGCVGSAFAFGYVNSPNSPYTGPRPPSENLTEVFLTSSTSHLKDPMAKKVLHGNGSHLVMMDGHVALLPNAEMQESLIKSEAGTGYRYLAANETSTEPVYWISP